MPSFAARFSAGATALASLPAIAMTPTFCATKLLMNSIWASAVACDGAAWMTTSALISPEKLIAEAVAETDVEARLIPRLLFDRLLAKEPEFRREVLRNYAERVTDLVPLIQDALFHCGQPFSRGLIHMWNGPTGKVFVEV
jgi:hypothetical protein